MEIYRHQVSWWTALPYSWTHALSFLMLPGWVVWWCILNATSSSVVALILGFVANALAYAALAWLPVLAVELIIRQQKSPAI
jgi:hypothetical protein